MFQVLDRDGSAPGPEEAGWKDTVAVGSRESVSVITEFTENLGTYVDDRGWAGVATLAFKPSADTFYTGEAA
jgi:hypothetical protein